MIFEWILKFLSYAAISLIVMIWALLIFGVSVGVFKALVG
jgi:hypothetical protein